MIKRREFLDRSIKFTAGAGIGIFFPRGKRVAMGKNEIIDEKTYLSEILYTKQEVDDWFAGKVFPFSKYHGEFGWLLNSAQFRDGMDICKTK